ncbi:MAG TPA: flagellar assembly protein FliX [Xanthobacteraceae bacterium]|nr:flagellar assembly protein FliX [Xanthobacteraceae bacterium]
MRIQGANAAAVPTTSSAVRRRDAAGTGFSVAEEQSAQAPQAVAALRTVSGIEALIALQGEGEAGARRRRAVNQGRAALDALDQLKQELLGGSLDAATLRRLQAAALDLKEGSGDPRLDDLLAQIDLRLQVEIAKLSPAPPP